MSYVEEMVAKRSRLVEPFSDSTKILKTNRLMKFDVDQRRQVLVVVSN